MSALLNSAGWFILPGLATSFLHSLYYRIIVRAGDPHPPPGSTRYNRDRKRIYVLVIVLYLLYTVAEPVWQEKETFYSLLGVAPDADDKGIRGAFNRLARTQHPDKAGEAHKFVLLTRAKNTLLDPTKRFAYDRLGPAMFECEKCVAKLDFVKFGVSMSAIWYGVASVVMIGLQVLGYAPYGRYWRWVAFSGLILNDVMQLSRPYKLPYVPAGVLQFQVSDFFRTLLWTLSIALNQLGPVFTEQPVVRTSVDEQIQRMDALAKTIDGESTALLGVDMAPYLNDPSAMGSLKVKLRDWLVDQTIRADPEVRDAVGNVLRRR